MYINYNDIGLTSLIGGWERLFGIDPCDDNPLFKQREIVYHYTTLDAFWKVIGSDTFRATHVRYSNDAQEYNQGKDILEKTFEDKLINTRNCYMICFCTENDLLSQWREYGKNGASLGMDFRRQSILSILPNERSKSTREALPQYAFPLQVLYTAEAKQKPKEQFFFYAEDHKTFISFSELRSRLENQPDQSELSLKSQLHTIIPYIKHGAFAEEREARMIFSFGRYIGIEQHYVDFADSGGMKKPYLQVRYGNIQDKEKPCSYVDIGINLPLRDELKAVLLAKHPQLCIGDINDDPYAVYLSSGTNQPELFRLVEDFYQKKRNVDVWGTPNFKIWCDGYWPIRKITVGPNLDKDLICESITHYCQQYHYLKYVDVAVTDMPYRSKP